MCFDIGELDNWQVLLYLLGQAGAGKSTILMKIIHQFYDEQDVGVISQCFGFIPQNFVHFSQYLQSIVVIFQ